MVGAYEPCAEFIKLARMIKLDAVFVNISFVGSEALAEELGRDGEGVVVTQVVPLPDDVNIPLVARYQRALQGAQSERQAKLCLTRRLCRRSPGGRSAEQIGKSRDTCRITLDHQGCRRLRPGRHHAVLWTG